MSMLGHKHSGCQEIQLALMLTGFSPLETAYLTKEVSILHASFVSVYHLADSAQIFPLYTPCERPERYHHCLSYIIRPHGSLEALFPHFYQSDFRMDNLKHQNPQTKAWSLLTHETICRFVSYLSHLHERLFKAFCLRRWFLTMKTKLCKFSVL